MIDTLRLRSPELSPEQYARLLLFCEQIERKKLINDETVYQLHVGQLAGSYDASIGLKVTYLRLTIECSVAKLRQGHNVFGYSECIHSEAEYLIATVGGLLGEQLPWSGNWEVLRVDVAESYQLGSKEDAQRYIRGLGLCRYPRRKVSYYSNESINVPGRRFTLKLYHKGAEFAKHDAKRVKAFSESERKRLQKIADGIVRTEVSIRSLELRDMFGGYRGRTNQGSLISENPKVSEINSETLHAYLETKLKELFAEGENDMEIVRKSEDVKIRLLAVYGSRLGNILWDFWNVLARYGRDSASDGRSSRTVRRNLKLLRDASVSWFNTGLTIAEASDSNSDFRALRTDWRRIA